MTQTLQTPKAVMTLTHVVTNSNYTIWNKTTSNLQLKRSTKWVGAVALTLNLPNTSNSNIIKLKILIFMSTLTQTKTKIKS